jgi:hypothetical protein
MNEKPAEEGALHAKVIAAIALLEAGDAALACLSRDHAGAMAKAHNKFRSEIVYSLTQTRRAIGSSVTQLKLTEQAIKAQMQKD